MIYEIKVTLGRNVVKTYLIEGYDEAMKMHDKLVQKYEYTDDHSVSNYNVMVNPYIQYMPVDGDSWYKINVRIPNVSMDEMYCEIYEAWSLTPHHGMKDHIINVLTDPMSDNQMLNVFVVATNARDAIRKCHTLVAHEFLAII